MNKTEKNIDILTFKEWVENSICLSEMECTRTLFSLQGNKVFIKIRETFNGVYDKRTLEDIKKGVKSKTLKKIYDENYDWIQERHLNSLS